MKLATSRIILALISMMTGAFVTAQIAGGASAPAKGVCPTPLAEKYAGFSHAVKQASAEAARECATAEKTIRGARSKVVATHVALANAVADRRDAATLIELETKYIEAVNTLATAVGPFRKANHVAFLAFSDWSRNQQRSGIPLDMDVELRFLGWASTVAKLEKNATVAPDIALINKVAEMVLARPLGGQRK